MVPIYLRWFTENPSKVLLLLTRGLYAKNLFLVRPPDFGAHTETTARILWVPIARLNPVARNSVRKRLTEDSVAASCSLLRAWSHVWAGEWFEPAHNTGTVTIELVQATETN